jgi:hypothetical protein
MPYLNKGDHRIVTKEYQKWQGVKKKKSANKIIVRELTK